MSKDTYLALYSDVLLVNHTLQNLCLDFATLGDLKIIERPTVYTIAPRYANWCFVLAKVGLLIVFLDAD